MLKYMGAHWRGDLSLALSFWINAVVLSAVLSAVSGWWARTTAFQQQPHYAWVLLMIVAAYTIWSLTGLWRSASASIEKAHNSAPEGPVFWAYMAKATVVLSGVMTLITYVPKVMQLAGAGGPM